MTRISLALAILVFAGCVHVPYDADTGTSRSIIVDRGGGLWGDDRCLADGHYLVRELYLYDAGRFSPHRGEYRLRYQTKKILSPEQWAEFWHAIDAVGIERWKEKYIAGGVPDSPTWTVDLSRERKRYQCRGDIIYPKLDDPLRSASDDAALSQLYQVFERFGAAEPPH